MKKTLLGMLALSLVTTACGDTNDDEGGGGSGEKYQCHAVSWCTNMTPDDTEVTDAPALTGGTLKDGIYRLEQGKNLAYAAAMVIKGNNILWLDSVWSNTQGTWKVVDGKMQVHDFATCDTDGARTLDNPWDYGIAYGVRGDEIFTVNDLDDPKYIHRWKRVDDLCKTSASFNCHGGGTCVCESTLNKALTGNENCTLPY